MRDTHTNKYKLPVVYTKYLSWK